MWSGYSHTACVAVPERYSDIFIADETRRPGERIILAWGIRVKEAFFTHGNSCRFNDGSCLFSWLFEIPAEYEEECKYCYEIWQTYCYRKVYGLWLSYVRADGWSHDLPQMPQASNLYKALTKENELQHVDKTNNNILIASENCSSTHSMQIMRWR